MTQEQAEAWWAKMEFVGDFVRHYIGMDKEAAWNDIQASMAAMIQLDGEGDSFGSKMVRKAFDRINGKAAIASAENGKLGGRPPKKDKAAGGDTREDSQDLTDTHKGVTLEQTTPAATIENGRPQRCREGDMVLGRGNGSPTPVPENVGEIKADVSTSAISTMAVEDLTPPLDSTKKATPTSIASPLKKYPHGEFQNVMLTVDESAKLCMKLGPSADTLIEELSQYLASSTKAKYKSHYATLLNWSRRKAAEAEPKKRFKTTEDISRENYEASKARLDAYFAAKERKEA